MKFNKIIYTAILAIVLVFTSCEKDDYTGYSKVNFTPPTATYAITGGSNSISVDETTVDPADGVTYEITATISEAIPFDTYIDVTMVGGTATEGVDFSTERIRIRPHETTGTGSVTVYQTGDLEGDESFELKTNTNSPNVNGSETFTFNITNDYVNDDLVVNISWCGDYDFDLEALGLGHLTGSYDDIDIDGIVYDSAFNFVGYLGAGTTSCPENVHFSGLPDDTYYVVVDVYDNPLSTMGLGESIPLRASYSQEYFTSDTPILHSLSLTTDSSGTLGVMCSVEKNGYNFVVTAL